MEHSGLSAGCLTLSETCKVLCKFSFMLPATSEANQHGRSWILKLLYTEGLLSERTVATFRLLPASRLYSAGNDHLSFQSSGPLLWLGGCFSETCDVFLSLSPSSFALFTPAMAEWTQALLGLLCQVISCLYQPCPLAGACVPGKC